VPKEANIFHNFAQTLTMNIQQLYEICLSMNSVTEHFPFDDNTLVFKVGGKIFCLTSLRDWELGQPSVNLKCNPEEAVLLRESFEAVKPGYHMSKKHWNTVYFHRDVTDVLLVQMIHISYALVYQSLSQKIKNSIHAE
jgi:predicted DNA-binding protein (MmcQ/YjbR family)